MTDNSNREPGLVIEPGFRPEHRAVVAAGYWAAFSRKLRCPLGPEHKAIAFIEAVLDPFHAISAVAPDGAFLGVAGFKTIRGAFVGGDWKAMASAYGRFGAFGRSLLIGILERECEPGTLLMDGIFVRPQARGLGVGSALLDAIERAALARGLNSVRLDVIDENPRARALYERRGYEPHAQRSIGLLKPVFGFSFATTMIKSMGAPGPDVEAAP